MYKLTASITINIFLNLGMAAVSSILTTTEITSTRNSEASRAGKTVARKFSIGALYVCSGTLAILAFDKKNSTVRQGPIYVKLNVELTRKNDKASINGALSLALSSQQTRGVVMVTIKARWQCMSEVSTDPARFCVFLDRIRS